MRVSISWLPGLTGFAVNLNQVVNSRFLDSLGVIRGTEYKNKPPKCRHTMTLNEDGDTILFKFLGCIDHQLMQLEMLRLAIAFTWVPKGTTQLPMNRTARLKGKFIRIPLATMAS